MHLVGLEPTSLAALEPESSVCANFTTGATGRIVYQKISQPVNRDKRAEVGGMRIEKREAPQILRKATGTLPLGELLEERIVLLEALLGGLENRRLTRQAYAKGRPLPDG